MNEMHEVFKIIHRKDGSYDLYNDAWWITSNNRIDVILERLSKESQLGSFLFEFKDETIKKEK